MKTEILKKLREVKLFLFDLDGVLIHNNVFSEIDKNIFFELIDNTCKKLTLMNKKLGIVTARNDDEFINELRKILKCGVISSSIEKVTSVDKLTEELSIKYDYVFYMGDDILDIPLLKKCGVSAAPKSARREVKRVVKFIIKGESAKDIFTELFSYFDNTTN